MGVRIHLFRNILRDSIKNMNSEYLASWIIHNGYAGMSDFEMDWWEDQKREYAEQPFHRFSETRWKLIFGLMPPPTDRRLLAEEVIERIPIRDVISQFTKVANRQTKEVQAECPFHKDKHPSMSINTEKNLWTCYSCGRGGTIYNFLMEIEGLTFRQAHDVLEKMARYGN